jgi:hypothetical protein
VKRLRLLPLLGVLALGPSAQAASPPPGFGGIVRRFSQALHRSPEHPHLFGTMMFFVRLAHPWHTAGLHLALFSLPRRLPLDAFAQPLLTPAWSRMVLNEDRRDGDQSVIYIRPDHKRFQMLIVNQDGGDHQLTLVAVEVGARDLVQAADTHSHSRGR